MSFFKRTTLVIVLVLIQVSCSKESKEERTVDYKEGHIFAYEKGAPIPDDLVNMIEREYIKIHRVEKPEITSSDAEIAVSIPRRLLELDVFLEEQNEGTLVQDTRFSLPAGGGTINLAEYVNKGKGVFNFRVVPKVETYDAQLEDLKVYFVSNAKKLAIQGKNYGAGCGKFFDVTTFFQQQLSKDGYELAAAGGRYLGQTIGSFYFVLVKISGIYVGATSLIDTRYPKIHCLEPERGAVLN